LSTIGQNLSHQEKLFLAWLAPRGIVAASVSSVFALELTASGYPDAERLIPLTFIIIIVTVTLYGLSAVPLARKLKISEPNPQGVLLVGAHAWSIEFGSVLKELGFRVLLVDSNPVNIYSARAKGLDASFTNVLAEDVVDQIDLQGIGRIFAVTANDEVNALSALHFADLLGRSEVYQLPYKKKLPSEQNPVPRHLRGRRLFGENITYDRLQELFSQSQRIEILEIKTEQDIAAMDMEAVLPLVLVNAQKNLLIYTDEQQPKPLPGTILIYQNI
jgi:hypothetical protein